MTLDTGVKNEAVGYPYCKIFGSLVAGLEPPAVSVALLPLSRCKGEVMGILAARSLARGAALICNSLICNSRFGLVLGLYKVLCPILSRKMEEPSHQIMYR